MQVKVAQVLDINSNIIWMKAVVSPYALVKDLLSSRTALALVLANTKLASDSCDMTHNLFLNPSKTTTTTTSLEILQWLIQIVDLKKVIFLIDAGNPLLAAAAAHADVGWELIGKLLTPHTILFLNNNNNNNCCRLECFELEPNHFGKITLQTKIEFRKREWKRPAIEGIEELSMPLVAHVASNILDQLELVHTIQKNGMGPLIKGHLLIGPRGCGKTHVICLLLQHIGMPFLYIKASDLLQQQVRGTEKVLKNAFHESSMILVIDDFDTLLSSGGSRLVYSLESLFDNPISSKLIIGVLSSTTAFPSTLVGPLAFSSMIQMKLPDYESRLWLFNRFLNGKFSTSPVLTDIAKNSQGYTPADLLGIVQFAIVNQKGIDLSDDDLLESKKVSTPSNLSGIVSKVPKVLFKDLFGMSNTILHINNTVVEPLKNPTRYEKLGLALPQGILISGPSGVGKTALGCAIVNETGLSCIYVNVRLYFNMTEYLHKVENCGPIRSVYCQIICTSKKCRPLYFVIRSI
jgi:hypothetical protein